MKPARLLLPAVLTLAAVLLASDAGQASHAAFTVNSTGDGSDVSPGNGICLAAGGVCTLRAAIQEANAHAGTDTIDFSIGSGVQTITPGSALPTITQPVIIDGTTQPGFPGSPIIQLNGNGGAGDGLHITAGSSTVKGLAIYRFGGSHGIHLSTNGGNIIQGNRLGTDAAASANLGNAVAGVQIDLGSSGNIIGGVGADKLNFIKGNGFFGIGIFGVGTSGNVVQGNIIIENSPGSQNAGVTITGSNNIIGGTGTDEGNVILLNPGDGVRIQMDSATGNAIRGNSINVNGGLGIDLSDQQLSQVTPNDPTDGDLGPNNLQNFPVLTSAHSDGVGTTIRGSLDSTAEVTFSLDFYHGFLCDPSGFGEGPAYLGSATLTIGPGGGPVGFNVALPMSVPHDHQVTATATDSDGNTSEFSNCVAVSAAATTDRLSVTSSGQEANGRSGSPSMGIDSGPPFSPARFAGFRSEANNVVPGDADGLPDAFMVDRQTGAVEAVSVNNSGQLVGTIGGFQLCGRGCITANGRYAVFATNAAIDPVDTNGKADVYRRDRQLGVTTLVSVGDLGTTSPMESVEPVVNETGRLVAFQTDNALVPADSNNQNDIYVRDMVAGTTRLVSVDNSGVPGGFEARLPSVNPDGRFVGFITASALVAEDGNSLADCYAHDLQTDTTILVSKSTSGAIANGATLNCALSKNPHGIFVSEATNLVAGDGNGQPDIFVHALLTGVTSRASVATGGGEANGPSDFPSLSGNGRFIAFVSSATNLVALDNNAAPDVFVHDRTTGTTVRASLARDGSQIAGGVDATTSPAISSDGRHVAFASADAAVVPGDSNAVADVFLRDLGDIDGDGEPDPFDPCPANPDCDGDGGLDGMERHAGTDPSLFCSADTTADNEEPDARLTDFNDDRAVTGADLSAIAGVIGQLVPPAPVRRDIAPDPAGDNAVTGADLSRVAGVIGSSC